jgi:N(6)-adenine-specific DNA methyltransferase
MSILFNNFNVCYLSHQKFLNEVYTNVFTCDQKITFKIHPDFFKTSYGQNKEALTRKRKSKNKKRTVDDTQTVEREEIKSLKERFFSFAELYKSNFITDTTLNDTSDQVVSHTEDAVYKLSDKNIKGANELDHCILTNIADSSYLIPFRCKFFNNNIKNLTDYWDFEDKYDFILIDPPWWNKYIKRLKKRQQHKCYTMMSNEELRQIPLHRMISAAGIVAVWCTNSQGHIKDLRENMFKEWRIRYITTWHWIKVTKTCEPICEFNVDPTCKQPFEKIIIGVSENAPLELINRIEKDKIVVSSPSAHHSHKPPLIEIFKDILPPDRKCLELFARNLQPGFTSVGREVMKFQCTNYFERAGS